MPIGESRFYVPLLVLKLLAALSWGHHHLVAGGAQSALEHNFHEHLPIWTQIFLVTIFITNLMMVDLNLMLAIFIENRLLWGHDPGALRLNRPLLLIDHGVVGKDLLLLLLLEVHRRAIKE
jgi:hypothetical protein